MSREEQTIDNKAKVLSLVTKDIQSTKSIRDDGVQKGMFKNWSTYDKYLNVLFVEKKVSKIETRTGIFWKLR
jgi:hypothetical protein